MIDLRYWFSPKVLPTVFEDADQYAERSVPLETGGMLMGYWTPQGPVVIMATVSGPKAVHNRTTFVSDGNHDEAEAARIYEESGRIHTYLGDWHSHPGGSGQLSKLDKDCMATISEHQPSRCPRPLSVIVRGPVSPGEWVVCVWLLDEGRFSVLQPDERMVA